MVIFFFVVGLEIRREIHRGELSEWRRAALPAAAALGGMLAPAAVYLLLAGGPATRSGWGVPMATDIAFAVGVLTLLGKRVPAALRVLLLAVAVIDDLGAIMVIALFYSSGIKAAGIIVAAAGIACVFAMQRSGVRSKLAYILPSVVAWAGIYSAGVHPTIAGVVVGLITPVNAWLGPDGFLQSIRDDLTFIEQASREQSSTHELAASLSHLNLARREVLSPADALIEMLHPWVAFVIMPIFALANAGVSLSGIDFGPETTATASGVVAGLLIGKPLGIMLLSWMALGLGIAILPKGISYRHLLILGVVAGVGFTMSLFIAQLAFNDENLLSAAKLGVLVASAAAGLTTLLLGRFMLSTQYGDDIAMTADEAESSTEK
jgi:NhaA family Na+:H+ antiporter